MKAITKYFIIIMSLVLIVSCNKEEQELGKGLKANSYRQLSVSGTTSTEVKSPLSKGGDCIEEPLFKEVFSDLPHNETKAYYQIDNNDNNTVPQFYWEARNSTDSDVIMAVTTTDKKFVKWVDDQNSNEEFYSFASVTPDTDRRFADMITTKYLIDGAAPKISTNSIVFSLSPVKENDSEYGFKIIEKTETSLKATISAPVSFTNSQYINGKGKFDFRDMAYIFGSATVRDLPGVPEIGSENKPFSSNKITYSAIPAVIRLMVTNQTSNTQYVSSITIMAINKTSKHEEMLFPTKIQYVLNSANTAFSQVQRTIVEKRSGVTINFDQADVNAKRNEVTSSLNYSGNLSASQQKFYYALVLPTPNDNTFNNANLFFTVTTFDKTTLEYKQFVATLDGANLGNGGYYGTNQATSNNKFVSGGIYTFHLSMRDGSGSDRKNSLINKFVPPFNVMSNNVAMESTPGEYSGNNVISKSDLKRDFLVNNNVTQSKIINNLRKLDSKTEFNTGSYYVPTIHHYQTIFRGGTQSQGINISTNGSYNDIVSYSKPESKVDASTYVSRSDYRVIDNKIYSIMLKRLPSGVDPSKSNDEIYLRSDKYRMAYRLQPSSKDGVNGLMIYSYFLGEFNPLTIEDLSTDEFWDNNPFVQELFFQNGSYWTLPYNSGEGVKDYLLNINTTGKTGYYSIIGFGSDTDVPPTTTNKLRLFKVLNN